MSQDTIQLSVEPRTVLGKAVKQLRRDGFVPAVIHDHGKDSVVVAGNYIEVYKAYQKAGKHHPIQLKAGGKTYSAMIKEVAFDPQKHQINHVVFNAVKANEKVAAEVPVHPQYAEGNEASPAERAGLLVLSNLTSVMVEATPANLPDALYYDAEKLIEVGDHATVADLIVPEGVVVTAEESQGIASVYEPSAVAAANDAAGGTEEVAEGEAAASVESEAGSPADDTDSQAAEDQPGGKAENQAKGE